MPRKRARSERGAVAVEAALVTPILILILFGIVEMSLLMRDAVAVTSSVRTGARVASVAAGAGEANCLPGVDMPVCSPATTPKLAQAAADAIQRASSSMPKDSIDSIIVYQANKQGYPLPDGNTTLACTSACVRYEWSDTLDKFKYEEGKWISTTINACINDANRMAVGIAMEAKHSFITGLFGAKKGLSDRSVMQFEPLPQDQCKPGTHA